MTNMRPNSTGVRCELCGRGVYRHGNGQWRHVTTTACDVFPATNYKVDMIVGGKRLRTEEAHAIPN